MDPYGLVEPLDNSRPQPPNYHGEFIAGWLTHSMDCKSDVGSMHRMKDCFSVRLSQHLCLLVSVCLTFGHTACTKFTLKLPCPPFDKRRPKRNLRGSGMSHTTTASPKPSFRAPCRAVDALVGRRSFRWTTSNSIHPCLYLNCSQRHSAENTG